MAWWHEQFAFSTLSKSSKDGALELWWGSNPGPPGSANPTGRMAIRRPPSGPRVNSRRSGTRAFNKLGEIYQAGDKSLSEMRRLISAGIFDVDPDGLGLMHVDPSVDIHGVDVDRFVPASTAYIVHATPASFLISINDIKPVRRKPLFNKSHDENLTVDRVNRILRAL